MLKTSNDESKLNLPMMIFSDWPGHWASTPKIKNSQFQDAFC